LGLAWARNESRALVPWAWAVNGAIGSLAASLSPILASVFGCRALLLLGTGCYFIVLLIYLSSPSIHAQRD
jgi:hypothetical protein